MLQFVNDRFRLGFFSRWFSNMQNKTPKVSSKSLIQDLEVVLVWHFKIFYIFLEVADNRFFVNVRSPLFQGSKHWLNGRMDVILSYSVHLSRSYVFVFLFCIRLPPELLPVLGPPTLDAALLCSSRAGSDLGRVSVLVWGANIMLCSVPLIICALCESLSIY